MRIGDLYRRYFPRTSTSGPATLPSPTGLHSSLSPLSTPERPYPENEELRDAQVGKRCFILCNGPSVKRQDIRALAGEFVISVSNGYHHPEFSLFAPKYHCVPQITYGVLSRDDVIAWFEEMHSKLGNTSLILSLTEKALVEKENLFAGRKTYYVDLKGTFPEVMMGAIPDLTCPIPGVQSVSIMSIMVAMWAGSKEIYLLGVDHDHFRIGEYKYFFEPTLLRGKDNSVDADGKVVSWHDEFHAPANLWGQYRIIKQIAAAYGVTIINSTAGGELDEFPRRALEEVIAKR